MAAIHARVFMNTFGVKRDISSFSEVIQHHGGGEMQKRPNGPSSKPVRGYIITCDVLPLPLLKDLFNLVKYLLIYN